MNNISILEGSVTLNASSDGEPLQTSWELDFPSGYSSENCICIGFGTSSKSSTLDGYSYGTGFTDVTGIVTGEIPRSIKLGELKNLTKIECKAYNILQEKTTLRYRIVLLKIKN